MALFAVLWSAVATLIIGLAIKYTIGLRLDPEDEVEGIDFVEHGESAYDLSTGGGARRTSVLTSTATSPTAEGARA